MLGEFVIHYDETVRKNEVKEGTVRAQTKTAGLEKERLKHGKEPKQLVM